MTKPFHFAEGRQGVDTHVQTDVCAPPTPVGALKPVTERPHIMSCGVHWCTPVTRPQASTDIASNSGTTQHRGWYCRLDE